MDSYGPPLPPGFKLPADESSESDSEQPKKKFKVLGPQIPSFLATKQSDDEVNLPAESLTNIIGPVLPSSCTKSSNSDDGDSDVYGPMPPKTKIDYDVVGMIEKRAASMKNKLDNKDAPKVEKIEREEWMVVPDTSRRNQLGAISRCLDPGSKVVKKETVSYHNPEEDQKTSEELKKYNKSKRGKSLLEIHQKKKKKKDKKEKKSGKEERKAFDRDEIAVRQFNKTQVNSVIDKAKYLNSRFSAGKSQFL